MAHEHSFDALVERVCRQWEARRAQNARISAVGGAKRPLAIALERQAGVLGTSIARAVGQRLGWQVYDHELLERIAKEMGLRASLLESVDERHAGWLREVADRLMEVPSVSENGYLQHLISVVLALGALGECVIVGRGASQILPPETTLRVLLVAPIEDRTANVMRQRGLEEDAARRHVKAVDRERRAFVRAHFHKDATESTNYDLLLNAARFTLEESADLIVEGLRRLSRATPSRVGHAAG